VWSFTTGSGGIIPPAPTLIAPLNGSIVPDTTVTFQWASLPGAIEYYFCQKRGVGYSFSRLKDAQVTLPWFRANTTYEWWVMAVNNYAVGPESEKWQFSTPAIFLSLSGQPLDNYIFIEAGSTILKLDGYSYK
jgi:hypothetical protein